MCYRRRCWARAFPKQLHPFTAPPSLDRYRSDQAVHLTYIRSECCHADGTKRARKGSTYIAGCFELFQNNSIAVPRSKYFTPWRKQCWKPTYPRMTVQETSRWNRVWTPQFPRRKRKLWSRVRIAHVSASGCPVVSVYLVLICKLSVDHCC